MSDTTDPTELSGDDLLAAEFALGLLEGEELLMARSRLAREPELGDKVAFWQDRLAPLMDEIVGAAPGDEVWQRIRAALDAEASQVETRVVSIDPRLRKWQLATWISSAAAVLLLAVVLWPQTSTAPQPGPATPQQTLVAYVPIEGTPLGIDLTYIPEERSLLVAAAGLTHDGVHDHELWLVRPEGAVESLGVVTPGEIRAHSVPEEFSTDMSDGAQLVLTREPLGGKPEGQDAGPVVAEGRLTTI